MPVENIPLVQYKSHMFFVNEEVHFQSVNF